jgi:hypothetical protein
MTIDMMVAQFGGHVGCGFEEVGILQMLIANGNLKNRRKRPQSLNQSVIAFAQCNLNPESKEVVVNTCIGAILTASPMHN